jgi:hypothetical protein
MNAPPLNVSKPAPQGASGVATWGQPPRQGASSSKPTPASVQATTPQSTLHFIPPASGKVKNSKDTRTFQEKIKAYWQQHRKGVTVAGGITALALSGLGVAHYVTRHGDLNAMVTKHDTAREVGVFRKDLDRLEEILDQALQDPKDKKTKKSIETRRTKQLSAEQLQATRAKDKFDITHLVQEAFNISRLKQSASVDSNEAEQLKIRAVSVALNYAVLFDRDQLPSLVKQIYTNGGFHEKIFPKLKVAERDRVGIPGAKKYLDDALTPTLQFKENIRAYNHFTLGLESYHQTHMALSFLTKYGAAKDARQLLNERGNALFLRTESNYKTPESQAELVALMDLYAVYFRKYDPTAYSAIQEYANRMIKQQTPGDTLPEKDRNLLNSLETHLGITNTSPLEVTLHSSPVYRSERLRDILRLRLQITEPTPNNQMATDGNAPYLDLNHYMNDIARKLTLTKGDAPPLSLHSPHIQDALKAIKARYDIAASHHETKHFLNYPGQVEAHIDTIHQFSKAIKPHLPSSLANNASFMRNFEPYANLGPDKLYDAMMRVPVSAQEAEKAASPLYQGLDDYTERFHTFLNEYWNPVLLQLVKHSVPEKYINTKSLPHVPDSQ